MPAHLHNMPVGQVVNVVCVGVKDNKMVASVKELRVEKSKSVLLDDFQATSSEQFRNLLTRFGTVTQRN